MTREVNVAEKPEPRPAGPGGVKKDIVDTSFTLPGADDDGRPSGSAPHNLTGTAPEAGSPAENGAASRAALLAALDSSSEFRLTLDEGESSAHNFELSLDAPRPNPASPHAKIALDEASEIDIDLVDGPVIDADEDDSLSPAAGDGLVDGTPVERPLPPPVAPAGAATRPFHPPQIATGEERLAALLASIAAQSHYEERYTLRGELARGGMGCVFRARDLVLGRDVAVKMMRADRPSLSSAEALRGQFLKEARVGGRLLHPHVLPVFDLGVNRDGLLYYTMRLVEGASLQSCLGAVGTAVDTQLVGFPLRKLTAALLGVCRGIDHAHLNRVLHLDLKPANILMSGFREVFVIDWGLARVDDVDDTEALIDLYRQRPPDPAGSGFERTDAPESGPNRRVVGTPSYMAPEQARGDVGAFGPATDVYGLGGILHFVLYGQPPNRGAALTDVLKASRRAKPRPELRPGILPRGQRVKADLRDAVAALEAVALKALEPDPGKRFPTADGLVVELEEWLAAAPV